MEEGLSDGGLKECQICSNNHENVTKNTLPPPKKNPKNKKIKTMSGTEGPAKAKDY